jgi:hypothetical protein
MALADERPNAVDLPAAEVTPLASCSGSVWGPQLRR